MSFFFSCQITKPLKVKRSMATLGLCTQTKLIWRRTNLGITNHFALTKHVSTIYLKPFFTFTILSSHNQPAAIPSILLISQESLHCLAHCVSISANQSSCWLLTLANQSSCWLLTLANQSSLWLLTLANQSSWWLLTLANQSSRWLLTLANQSSCWLLTSPFQKWRLCGKLKCSGVFIGP